MLVMPTSSPMMTRIFGLLSSACAAEINPSTNAGIIILYFNDLEKLLDNIFRHILKHKLQSTTC